MFDDALTRRRRVLGERHPYTINIRQALTDPDARDPGTTIRTDTAEPTQPNRNGQPAHGPAQEHEESVA
ncbi:hypothetical protein [Candidatus Protofrankia datiscae]|nr:hypothetical protein [Candidatus Protofrankia datiscae]